MPLVPVYVSVCLNLCVWKMYKKVEIIYCTASYKPFYIERDPRSRTGIGERDTLVVHRNEATVAWPKAIACHRPRRQCGVIRTYPPPPIVHSHGQNQ